MKIYYKTSEGKINITDTEVVFDLLQNCNPEIHKYQVTGLLDEELYVLPPVMFFLEEDVFDTAAAGLNLKGKLFRLREEFLSFLGKKESDLNGSFLKQVDKSAFHEWI